MQRKFRPRHEIKYFLSDFAARSLAARLAATLNRDEHAGATGDYFIRSVYFDDAFDTALVDKLDGVAQRDKYRIRIYGGRDSEIFLERKRKINDRIDKDSAPISRRTAERLLRGDTAPLLKMEEDVARDFYCAMRLGLMRPCVIVDYAREAYVHPAEHTRVTFDKDIATGLYARDPFDFTVPTVRVLPPLTEVMEVKFDEYLPDYVAALLSSEHADRCAISKYTMCRAHEM